MFVACGKKKKGRESNWKEDSSEYCVFFFVWKEDSSGNIFSSVRGYIGGLAGEEKFYFIVANLGPVCNLW